MYHHKWPAIAGLVTGTICLSRTLPTTFAFDKPLLTSCILLASLSLVVSAFSRYPPQAHHRKSFKGEQQYDALPLEEVGREARQKSPSPTRAENVRYPSILRDPRKFAYILIGAICLRIEVLRHVLANTQCHVLSWEAFIPVLFACWDSWTLHRHKQRPAYDDPHSTVYDALEQAFIRSHFRYVLVVGLMSFGSLLALASSRTPPSTYICALALSNRWLVPVLQHLGTILDAVIALIITRMLYERDRENSSRDFEGGERNNDSRTFSVGYILTRATQISTAGLFVIGFIYFIAAATMQERSQMFVTPGYYVWDLLKLDFLLCVTLTCALITVFHAGLTTVSMITTFVSICTTTTIHAWRHLHAFPPPDHNGLAYFAVCLAMFAFVLYFHLEAVEHKTFGNISGHHQVLFTNKVPSWLYFILLMVFFMRTTLWASQSTRTAVNYHPIDLLIFDAQPAHEAYVKQASSSKTLENAVKNYRDRYDQSPPPGFDHWYRYATERNSLIIDDFDSIYHDLLPFYALDPAEIRHRTWQIMANPWHDATGLSIRNGKVQIITDVYPNHRWMMEALVNLIEHFSEWLPDMDLVFNTNDEPRIAAWYEDITQLQLQAGLWGFGTPKNNSFSEGRAQQWEPVPKKPGPKVMKNLSWQNIFNEWGAAGCPPGSPARNQRSRDRGRLCTSCAAPHSIGAFLSNWTTAGDICHQPDLAYLHGFYSSPSAFKGSHKLYPIFSQSKAHGFNDILYPSPWNYMDKGKYAPTDEFPDPPWAEKSSTLFWRGGTSEGMSPDWGQWKGFSRQRFVHTLNDFNTDHAILLPETPTPDGPTRQKHKYTTLTPPTNLHTDIHFVGEKSRVWDKDRAHQNREFGSSQEAPPIPFQAHWRHKYLLDLDGAGFSGRFLPFLASRSLPFKARGAFREWWDDRLTAWKHFVPLDVRAHGVWATLAYFAAGREVEGEVLAREGREWAGRVLRKEDMEVYFFRLLLEWGRLTDDGRDGLGFSSSSSLA